MTKRVSELTDEQKEKRREYQREWHRKNAVEMRKRSREWAINNRDRHNTNQLKSYHSVKKYKIFNRKYGITKEQYDKICEISKCQVCGRQFTGTQSHNRRYIDHCHTTGVIRGVLCRDCNLSEGLMKTPENALRLYEYMKKNELFYQGDS
jgi:hypothetical protein